VYFFDGAEAAKIRQDNNQEELKEDLLEELDVLLRVYRPYYTQYKNARELLRELGESNSDVRIGVTPQYTIFLETGEDRQRGNLPSKYEVAALIPEE
jgi:hypothetical protein